MRAPSPISAKQSGSSPNDPCPVFNRGFAFSLKGTTIVPSPTTTRQIRIAPTYVAALTNRGSVWSDKGDNDRAMADFNAALRINRNTPRGALFARHDTAGNGRHYGRRGRCRERTEDRSEGRLIVH